MANLAHINIPCLASQQWHPVRIRRGVTMIELLVVIMIMLMVTAAAIPVVAPAMQNRRMREAARSVSSVFAGARSRAIENGRPAGVMIERFNGKDFAMTLSYVEVPLPYIGDFSSSRALVNSDGSNFTFATSDLEWKGLLRQGDLVRLDLGGVLYKLQAGITDGQVITAAPPWSLVSTSLAPVNLPPRYQANPVPFQIIRQPVRSSAPPVQLPEGAVIDLANSGETAGNSFGTPLPFNPVVIFSPNGSVDWVVTGNRHRPNGPLFFLLGRRDLMADVAISTQDENLFDPLPIKPKNLHLQNFWIAVGPQTGIVSVTENAQNANDLITARTFAITAQSTGGR